MTDTMNAHDRAISNAVIDLTHAITEICDYLYWLRIDSPEDQANLRELKNIVRNSAFNLNSALQENN